MVVETERQAVSNFIVSEDSKKEGDVIESKIEEEEDNIQPESKDQLLPSTNAQNIQIN